MIPPIKVFAATAARSFYIREAAEKNDANLVDRLNRLQRDQLRWGGNFYGHMFTEDAEQILPGGGRP